jgi:membrane fusion protein
MSTDGAIANERAGVTAANLFRQEALNYSRMKIWGEATLSLPRSLGLMTAFLCASVALSLLFLASGTYARKEPAKGFTISTAGVAKITAPRPGVITAVHVAEGDIVAKNAPLLTISEEKSTSLGDGVDAAALESLHQQQSRLHDQIVMEQRKTDAGRQRLLDDIRGLASEVSGLEEQLQVQYGRTEIARQQVASIVQLVKQGTISRLELRRREDAHLAQKQLEADLGARVSAKKTELLGRRTALEQLPAEAGQRISVLENSVAEIDIKLKEAEGRRAYWLTAPVAGRVSALQAWTGKSTEPNVPQLSIVPDGGELKAQLLVPARAIGFASPGQPVRVRFDSFPYQQFGSAAGTIETVSHTLLKPAELVGPVIAQAPSYLVSVRLKHPSIWAYGREIPLQADMQLQADIVLQYRTLLTWIFDPLISSWRRP